MQILQNKKLQASAASLENQVLQTAEQFYKRAQSRLTAKRYADACKDLEQAIILDPSFANKDTFLRLDHCASSLKNWTYKMEICKRWADAKPEVAGAINHYAWALLTCPDKTLRDYKQALSMAEKAAQLTKNKDSDILDTLALAQFENKDIAEAIATQSRAIELLPANAPQAKRNEFEARKQQYESALKELE